jgi:hypothetical protein
MAAVVVKAAAVAVAAVLVVATATNQPASLHIKRLLRGPFLLPLTTMIQSLIRS